MEVWLIEWVDSVASGGNWEPLEMAGDMELKPCYTAGILIAEDADKVIMALACNKYDANYNCVMLIPKGCVLNMTKLWQEETTLR